MPRKTLYPRSTIRRMIKAHSGLSISKDADILIFLDYTLFLQDLIRAAAADGKKNKERGLTARAIEKVTEGSLRKFKA